MEGLSCAKALASGSVTFRKTLLCRYFPRCTKGDACPYAHTEAELRTRPDFTKTRICAGFRDGRCKLSASECLFAHRRHDLHAVLESVPVATAPRGDLRLSALWRSPPRADAKGPPPQGVGRQLGAKAVLDDLGIVAAADGALPPASGSFTARFSHVDCKTAQPPLRAPLTHTGSSSTGADDAPAHCDAALTPTASGASTPLSARSGAWTPPPDGASLPLAPEWASVVDHLTSAWRRGFSGVRAMGPAELLCRPGEVLTVFVRLRL
mmetsp:Transcript_119035/g.333461  ORF Transcript_119035/g.333461 Transcript_119035/m.333461 type:complete len:266 (+) Transcript_119035:58-855(+)